MNRSLVVVAALLVGAMSGVSPAPAAATTQPAGQSDPQAVDAAEASYQRRAASVVGALHLDDPAKLARVQDVLIAQYRAIRAWHAANDATRKMLSTTRPDAPEAREIRESYQALHDHFISALSVELTAEQIDTVKEKMTGGQMTATLRNYPMIVLNLSDEEKAMVATMLEQARDEAIDSGSKTERIAIFKKYKGRINVYLNAHGHNVAQAYKDWGAAQKAKQMGATSQPVGASEQ
jgi:hypothetical protein